MADPTEPVRMLTQAAEAGSLLAGVGAILALIISIILYRGQKKISKELQANQDASAQALQQEQHKLTLVLQERQEGLTRQLHEEQKLLAQRQMLIPIWEHLIQLHDIDPREGKTIWPNVTNAANTLELIALCEESGVMDASLVRRAFAGQYLYLYRTIEQCIHAPPGQETGPAMLDKNRAAKALFKKLEIEDLQRDAVTAIGVRKP